MPQPRSGIRDLVRISTPQSGRYERLRLDKNENISGFSPEIIQEMLSNVSPHFLAAYPEPGVLYQKIAKKHDLPESHVLVTAGSEMAIRYVFETYLDKGDEVVFLDPSFAMFEVFANICGATSVRIPFGPNLSLSVDDIVAAIGPKTKIVAIANPNNPTGTVLSETDLLRLAEHCEKYDVLFLVDEAYFYFHPETMFPHLKRFKNMVVTRTFSKALGLASIRLGYALGSPEILSFVAKLQPIDHCNAFALKLGEYILDHENLIGDYVNQVEEGKDLVVAQLSRLGVRTFPTAANFLLIDLGNAPTKSRILAACSQAGILLGTHIRLPFENQFVRISLGPREAMERLLKVLEPELPPVR
ncbi:MAG: histidinol-phosphate aminotransferase family protein [Deltaproteobacteria bacterium]|nr:histidinol-phosphate aminotransferase family protein [Deltaproteobacteria bacterium]MBI3294147.1 histidinol-phosphate aminotransferase family protein [Deltaproteobacteria bacterium]